MGTMMDGWAGSDVMVCLGFGRMSSFIKRINTFLREFEREPGHERRKENEKKQKKRQLLCWVAGRWE